VGSASAVETPARVILAFYRRRQWRQAELARELDITVETLLRTLRTLSSNGMPLIRDDSDKPHVWWRVRKDWVPQGILFARDQIPALLRVLARAPRSRERDALLAHASRSARAADATVGVQAPEFSDLEQAWLSVVEDAARGTTLAMRYTGSARGTTEWRYASVQRIAVGPPSRFVAICHRSGRLQTFRIDGISVARLDPATAYRKADDAEVDAVLRRSIGGYEGGGQLLDCAFVVRLPEARWVALNLPSGMAIDSNETVADGVRVRCSTAAVLQVARFVVGLGEAARVETPELAACVRGLARGALTAGEGERGLAKRLLRTADARSVPSNRGGR
jgi:predicted DNA-binding transcriptional regulator YafY